MFFKSLLTNFLLLISWLLFGLPKELALVTGLMALAGELRIANGRRTA